MDLKKVATRRINVYKNRKKIGTPLKELLAMTLSCYSKEKKETK